MLELIKLFLEKLDFVAIAKALRGRKNRRAAARLHLVLVQVYEIIELYGVLLDELEAALKTHQRSNELDRFFLNPARVEALLGRQGSNLEVLETLSIDLLAELRILDNRFAEAIKELVPGKASILSSARGLLADARISLSESGPDVFPSDALGT
jgi:hypothetical protein